MNSWADGINNALIYIEKNLTENLNISDIAAAAYTSPFHFQRIFGTMCGITVGEYIRSRRLTQAAEELSAGNKRIIDIALKYGYESQDSFSRAFRKFHGITPSTAREKGAKLKVFAPLKIKLILEGGTMLEYKIVKKAAFTVMGKSRRFTFENNYGEIPKFWEEHLKSEERELICGMFGLCIDSTEQDFEYIICDNYIPQNEIPNGCVTRTIPAGTWAIFPVKGELPESLQNINTRIWNEWLPNCREYKLAGNYNIEMYTAPSENPAETYSEIWVPIEHI